MGGGRACRAQRVRSSVARQPRGRILVRRNPSAHRLWRLPVTSRRYERIQLQPGLAALLATLQHHGVRIGIATRNNPRAVSALLRAAGLPEATFDPVLTREDPHPDKPHPAIARAAAAEWGVSPESCLFVGDSLDDARCGRAAGMATCLLAPTPPVPATPAGGEVEPVPTPPPPPLPDEVDFTIGALAELGALVADAVRPD